MLYLPGVDGSRDAANEARVYALLGPTNTGKTHRAIERMLEFDSGIMGLPLRLLAREVYDRVSARLGEQAVALVTGEEKRVPRAPRYWICTVEAMPRDQPAAFVAVDEIQLVNHPERGHVFTDRLLFFRGREETWFMGAESAERLLRTLLPELRVRKLPRLSQLRGIGQSSLRTLPRRSAVVAFNLPQVYELADALRARRGGAAVVLGALSPRVRNAQVALYQAGEVDFLVATDAIGMGLNLDIHHVALAARSKFDGFETRELEGAEIAQIVGRAGRYLRDGTFGTLSPEPELPPGLVAQLEQHRFPSLRFAYYRNTELDFSSVTALLASLAERPGHPALRAAPDADDLLVLRVLAQKPEVVALCSAPHAVRTLWDVCRIPNYEKRIPEHQAARLLPMFTQLVTTGRLDAAWVDRELTRLDRRDGDIHQLMERMAAVRTFTYASHQSGWLAQAERVRARARDLEDRLGDLLHERLIERFVSHERPEARVARSRQRAIDERSPFAKLAELELYNAAERTRARDQQAWVERLVEVQFEDLVVDAHGEIRFEGARVARLIAGPVLLRPEVKLLLPAWVAPGSRDRIQRRFLAYQRDLVNHLLLPLKHEPERALSPPVRGLLYQLERGLGTVPRRQALAQLSALSPEERAALSAQDVVLGHFSLFSRGLLTPDRMTLRLALCRVFDGEGHIPQELDGSEPYWPLRRALNPALLFSLGFVALPPVALRCDVAEALRERLLSMPPEAQAAHTQLVLGCPPDLAATLTRSLTRPRRKRRRRPSR